MRTQPVPWFTICSRRPLRTASSWRDGAEVLFGHVDRDALDRLVQLAVDLSRHDLGLADGELEALAAHRLDEHRELELAAPLHLPRVGSLGRQHAQRHVADELGVEAVLHESRGELVALGAGERRRVDADRHRQARVVDVDDGQRARVVGIGERLADRHVGEPGDRHDLARAGLVGVDAFERLGEVQLGDLDRLDRAVGAAPRDRRAACAACRGERGTARGARRTATRRGW